MKLISGFISKRNVSIMVLILFSFVFISSLSAQDKKFGTETTYIIAPKDIPKDAQKTIVIVTACLIIGTFIGVLLLGWSKDHKLDKGEMRRAIAGTFVIGFTILMILCITFNIYQKEVIIAYIELVGIVVGFYFGAKVAAEKKEELAAEYIKSAQSDKSETNELKKKIIDYYNKYSSDQEKVDKIVKAIQNAGYTDWISFKKGEPSLESLKKIRMFILTKS